MHSLCSPCLRGDKYAENHFTTENTENTENLWNVLVVICSDIP
jgi:hypothetical protein